MVDIDYLQNNYIDYKSVTIGEAGFIKEDILKHIEDILKHIEVSEMGVLEYLEKCERKRRGENERK